MAEWASVVVGRREELSAFERALAEVGRGEPRVVALRGEPGIGKSRLLVELAGRAREHGLLVLEGRAAELERDLTFALLVDALDPVASKEAFGRAVGALEGWQAGALTALLPSLRPLVAVDEASASGERHRVARAGLGLCWPLRRRGQLSRRLRRSEPPQDDTFAQITQA